jgi:2,4-dienoyl-CoA reductase-like NADH-dependent reductase (Old Yellow Enzyme family)
MGKESGLFSQTRIGALTLANRFVRSATWEALCDAKGMVTDELVALYVRLARGEVGLIMTGHCFVAPEGQAGPGQMACHDREHFQGLAAMVEAVHAAGGRIMLQLAHAGCMASPALTGRPPLGPSSLADKGCLAMEGEDLERTVSAFARAAGRARAAGFDGVQIHAAHGYLLSQFLSGYFNQRNDAYGGVLQNRARLPMEVYRAVRAETGPDYPVWAKLNCEDFLENGLTLEEMLTVSSTLRAAGLDGVEMSGGTGLSGSRIPVRQAENFQGPFYLEQAARFQETVDCPLMLVGGIRSLEQARDIVGSGLADLVAMSRPLLAEPDLVAKWRKGKSVETRCASDNLCLKGGHAGEGVYCRVTDAGLDLVREA